MMNSLEMKRLNILFFFSDTLVGGAETNIIKIAKELKKCGHNIFMLSLEDNGMLSSAIKREGYKFLILGRYEQNFLRSIRIYLRFLKDNDINIVSTFGLRVDIFSRIVKFILCRRTILVSNIRASENWRKWYHTYLDRITAPAVNIWVSNSYSAKKIFSLREGIDINKIEVIYNFIELNTTLSTTIKKNIDCIRIGVLANYKRSKGHFNLIKISMLLSDMNILHNFICAGYDYTNGEFQLMVTKSSCKDNFKLLGFVEDKNRFFNEIDIMLLPSYIEGLPTSIIEAMAYGIPVIASNVDGIPEVITNDFNGFLTDPDDFKGFADYIKRIYEYDVRRFFQTNSFNILRKKFDKDTNVMKWRDLFEGFG